MRKLIISPVGTSLLSNITNPSLRADLYRYANHDKESIPIEVQNILNEAKRNIQEKLSNEPISELKKMSAELNGIFGYYANHLQGNENDIHFLIATDTYQGSLAASLLRGYLADVFEMADVYTPEKLNTKSKEDFRSGIRDLLKWMDENLPVYRNAGFKIVFNLTGGFKSLLGYLNTIGMFYADEIIYIFEGSDELITIPKLPIEIDNQEFKNNAAIFLQLELTNVGIEKDRLGQISNIFIQHYENNRYILSDWGSLSWNKISPELLVAGLVDLPYITYESSFVKDFNNILNSFEKVKVHKKIARVSCLLQENKGDIAALKGGRGGGLLYDNYTGINSHLGHFRLNNGDRISCQYIGEMLYLRHLGKHDYVNKNP